MQFGLIKGKLPILPNFDLLSARDSLNRLRRLRERVLILISGSLSFLIRSLFFLLFKFEKFHFCLQGANPPTILGYIVFQRKGFTVTSKSYTGCLSLIVWICFHWPRMRGKRLCTFYSFFDFFLISFICLLLFPISMLPRVNKSQSSQV